jgi:hypothetical protein
MWLIQQAAILEIRHHIANRGRTQNLFKPLGNCARGYRFACLDIRSDDIRQNLAVSPLL